MDSTTYYIGYSTCTHTVCTNVQSFPSHTFDAVSMVAAPSWAHGSVLLYQHLRSRVWYPNVLGPFPVHVVQFDHSVHGFLWQSSCTKFSSKFSNACPISFSIELLKVFPSWISRFPSASSLSTDSNLDVLEALTLQTSTVAKSTITERVAAIVILRWLFWAE